MSDLYSFCGRLSCNVVARRLFSQLTFFPLALFSLLFLFLSFLFAPISLTVMCNATWTKNTHVDTKTNETLAVISHFLFSLFAALKSSGQHNSHKYKQQRKAVRFFSSPRTTQRSFCHCVRESVFAVVEKKERKERKGKEGHYRLSSITTHIESKPLFFFLHQGKKKHSCSVTLHLHFVIVVSEACLLYRLFFSVFCFVSNFSQREKN